MSKKYTKEFLINEFWRFYKENNKYPRGKEMKAKNGYPSEDAYKTHWGTFNTFLSGIGVLGDNGWYKCDEDVLIEMYENYPQKEIIDKLMVKRKWGMIKTKASELKLNRGKEIRYASKTMSDEFLISELKRFYNTYDKVPTCTDFDEDKEFPSRKVYQNHFGSWNNALREAEMDINLQFNNYTKEDMIRVGLDHYNTTGEIPLSHEMGFSYSVLYKYWDDWNGYLAEINLKSNKVNKYSREELYFKCPSCGQISKNKMSVARLYITKNIKCNCTSGGSFSERFMSYILNKNKIDYIREYRPSWASILIEGKIRRCRYDFYFKIEDKQYIIEMDGCFHYMSNKYSEKSKMYTYIDSEKDRLAKEHNIEVIRIDCRSSTFDYVLRNCEESKLSDFLDFSLEKDSLAFIFNGYAVEICSLYKEGYGIKELSDKFNFTRATIRNYLDKGNEIGLVEYNRKENHKKNSQKQSMPVLVYTKEGIYVDRFPSMQECSRQSLTFSSKFIFDKEIRDVVISKRPFVKGFIFRREET